MPDLSLCSDSKCPTAKLCYRYMAEPDPHWQSYYAESPRKKGAKDCIYWLKICKGDRLRKAELGPKQDCKVELDNGPALG